MGVVRVGLNVSRAPSGLLSPPTTSGVVVRVLLAVASLILLLFPVHISAPLLVSLIRVRYCWILLLLSLLSIIILSAFNLPILPDPLPLLLRRVLLVLLLLFLVSTANGGIHVVLLLVWPLVAILRVVVHAFLPVL